MNVIPGLLHGLGNAAPAGARPLWRRLRAAVRIALLLAAGLLRPAISHAGENARVELGLAVSSATCGLAQGDEIEFLVAARSMANARLVKLEFSWQPPGAVAAVRGTASGLAREKAFVVPGDVLIEGNHGQFGMATFGTGMTGEGIIAAFRFELSAAVNHQTPVDIRLEFASLGTGFSERDTVQSSAALVLANYCDQSGQPLEAGLFIRPRQMRLSFSPASRAQVDDGSAGEGLFSARILENGGFLAGQPVTWTIQNNGASAVHVVGALELMTVPPGGVERGVAMSDARGDSYLMLDASPSPMSTLGSARLQACGERGSDTHCATAEVTWEGHATAIVQTSTAQPQQTRLGAAYPNPFNAHTAIPVRIAGATNAPVRLTIHDARGQLVALVAAEVLPAGDHVMHWNGCDTHGREVASGVYFCRLQHGSMAQSLPLALLR